MMHMTRRPVERRTRRTKLKSSERISKDFDGAILVKKTSRPKARTREVDSTLAGKLFTDRNISIVLWYVMTFWGITGRFGWY